MPSVVEAATRIRAGAVGRGARPGLPRRGRAGERPPQRLRAPRRRSRAGRGPRRRRGRAVGAPGRSRAARRRSVRREGPRGLRRHAHDPRLALVRRRTDPADRLDPRGSAPSRRRHPDRQDRRPRVRAWAYTASPLLGVTRNPWDPTRTPGGSSGGSSAAVSVGMVPFATASDGGGSIRTPAAFTVLVGLRPTYGRIPTFGDTHLAQNAVVGSVTTTVADTALLLDVMAGPDARDRTCLPAPPVRYAAALEADRPRGLPRRLVARSGLRGRRSRGGVDLCGRRHRVRGGHRSDARPAGPAARGLHADLRVHGGGRQVRRRRSRPVGAPARRARPAFRPRVELPQRSNAAVGSRRWRTIDDVWSTRWRPSTTTSICC